MLKPLRQALNLSVNELSDLIDVNERTIRRWEYGEVPTPKAVIMLLEMMVLKSQSRSSQKPQTHDNGHNDHGNRADNRGKRNLLDSPVNNTTDQQYD